MTTTAPTDENTYEHFIDPKTPGLGNLGTWGMYILFAGLLLDVVVIFFVGWVAGLVFLAVGGLLFLLVAVPDIEHQSRLQRLSARTAWKSNPGKTYVSGPLTRVGSYLLPGILAQTKAADWVTDKGQPFILVHTPSTNHYAVSWETHPDGASMTDPADLLANVKRWGEYLTFLCSERDAVQVMVTFTADQDHAKTLQTTVLGRVAKDAPEVAVLAAQQIVDKHQENVPSMRSFVTVTFKGNGSKKRDAKQMAESLGARLPKLTTKLSATGAGPCKLMALQRGCEEIRKAYDPKAAEAIDAARAEGNPVLMDWDSLGPPAAANDWEFYRHASGISVTWTMAAIRGAVTERSLIPLLQPHADVAVKRVSLIYQLHDPAVAPDIAETDVKAANFSINTSRNGPTVKHTAQQEKAMVNAKQEIGGHGLVNVAVAVTATVRSLEELPDAEATVDSLGPHARLLLRRNDGTQAASFAQNLPVIGLITKDHSLVPTAMRESL